MALELGLAGRARELLLESDVAAFGPRGMALELELLLRTGRASEVRDWTDPEQQEALGTSYHWLRAQALAASGDYALAEEECEELARTVAPGGQDAAERRRIREALATRLGQAVLEGQPGGGVVPYLIRQALAWRGLNDRLVFFAQSEQREANATVLAGLLALEEGQVVQAKASFRRALEGGPSFNGWPGAKSCLDWLEER